MRKLASVLVLLCVVGVGRAGEKDIRKALKDVGVEKGDVIVVIPKEQYRHYVALDFEGVQGTNALLAELCEIQPVQGLWLEKSDVTDTGMAAVGGLKGLKYLNLYHTGVTDVGLRQLEGLSSLEWLGLGYCPGITNEGVARLQKALPNCTIQRYCTIQR